MKERKFEWNAERLKVPKENNIDCERVVYWLLMLFYYIPPYEVYINAVRRENQ